MQRYMIDVDGRGFVVDVKEDTLDHFTVSVDGEHFDVTVNSHESLSEETGAGGVAIMPAAPGAASRSQAAPSAAPAAPAAAPRATARIPSPTAPRPAGRDTGVLAAPMPGVVLCVMVAPGAKVQRGQEVAVLEAMKMENSLRAAQDGIVVEVCVAAGQQVGPGDAILRFEAAS
jgi:glutaconyl-CoA/methylmalonyl-CoA decarboxylase subunit gamma